jgi:alkanesulfonate monooxygenase SsuD/methylene tetrahydromethanopterin reductase-like flavin-dependent oxidoreductase (luciferase family)
MRYGLYIPNFGKASGYAHTLAELASDAENSGWDGFFLWNHIIDERNHRDPMVDPFTALAAITTKTERIRLGTTVTPLARLRPWVVARQTATIDHLSNGRLILGVGLGFREAEDFKTFGEVPDNKVRAEKLDEALDIITGLWRGKPFSYQGKHYRIRKTVFLPPAKQKPRIPVWVGGFWPYKGPFRRAARWDGVVPLKLPVRPPGPEDLRDILAYIRKHRISSAHFDAAIIGWGTGRSRTKDTEKITPLVKAGMTWWLESLYTYCDSQERMRERIRKGPPGV